MYFIFRVPLNQEVQSIINYSFFDKEHTVDKSLIRSSPPR